MSGVTRSVVLAQTCFGAMYAGAAIVCGCSKTSVLEQAQRIKGFGM
jgi:hypothetical protein